jgi:hypothetical protein
MEKVGIGSKFSFWLVKKNSTDGKHIQQVGGCRFLLRFGKNCGQPEIKLGYNIEQKTKK